ncbi:metaxin, putative [Ixodes scapularis]|uniref:Metaxin, putative n=1 Tax=Ixodes scapularis TaxID=6945 RepID=B7Q5R0_IXOSC|nr:metaxin, putative [Ixodes scapularis]|eukprot:XP_002402196.1 metaxin, putative [Ixodes scapularis]
MELNIWKGDWGLPSIDTACLEALAYAKFSGAPLIINEVRRPWFATLPIMRHGPSTRITKFEDMVAHFRKQNYSADIQLTAQQSSDVRAYTAMLRQKLKPALLYLWWVDAKNYVELTRPWYARALAFPLNYVLPGQMQRDAMAALQCKLELLDLEGKQAETALLKEAQECLTTLSQRLGKDTFFFGKRPTSLDAVVFAHLAPLLKAPFPNAALQNHLKACENLAAFVGRILQQYFPPASADSEKGDRPGGGSPGSSDTDFNFSWLNTTLSVAFAAGAMLIYAVTSGLIQIEFQEAEKEAQDED